MNDRPRPEGPTAAPTADTRRPQGPEGRLYAAPFARVWDAIPVLVARRRLWSLVHADEESGLVTICCRLPGSGVVADVSIWVRLDANGLTRVDARSRSRRRWPGPAADRRRLEALLSSLDRALGPEQRVRS
ncbi:MAG: DUF1499 domain-containing protein [Gemmatimonadota bacterium]